MKKNNLKSGMVVEYRNGSKRLVINDNLIGKDAWNSLVNYDEHLTNKVDIYLDIVKVYNHKSLGGFNHLLADYNLELIWERKDIILTVKEIEILKALKILGFEFLARDEDDSLHAYDVKPHKVARGWDFNISVKDKQFIYIKVHNDGFDFIKWEDEESTKIDDLLKGVAK